MTAVVAADWSNRMTSASSARRTAHAHWAVSVMLSGRIELNTELKFQSKMCGECC